MKVLRAVLFLGVLAGATACNVHSVTAPDTVVPPEAPLFDGNGAAGSGG